MLTNVPKEVHSDRRAFLKVLDDPVEIIKPNGGVRIRFWIRISERSTARPALDFGLKSEILKRPNDSA